MALSPIHAEFHALLAGNGDGEMLDAFLARHRWMGLATPVGLHGRPNATALDVAILEGRADMVQALLERGAQSGSRRFLKPLPVCLGVPFAQGRDVPESVEKMAVLFAFGTNPTEFEPNLARHPMGEILSMPWEETAGMPLPMQKARALVAAGWNAEDLGDEARGNLAQSIEDALDRFYNHPLALFVRDHIEVSGVYRQLEKLPEGAAPQRLRRTL
jgi:hypothetical protein